MSSDDTALVPEIVDDDEDKEERSKKYISEKTPILSTDAFKFAQLVAS